MAQPVKKNIQEKHQELIKEEPTLTLVIDGNSLLFSSFADTKVNGRGEHVGGIFQFLLQIRMQLQKRVFDKIFVTFDNEMSGVLRYNEYKLYKANRDKNYADYYVSDYMREYNENLKNMQKAIFNKNKKPKEKSEWEKFVDENFDRERDSLCSYFNEMCIRWHMDEVCEGDDLIAYYCQHKKKNEKVLIISSDLDLCQLLSDDIMIYNQVKKIYISNKNFGQYFGYSPKNIMIKKVFCGDTSDNIGNIKGLSEKGFINLMPEIKTKEITIDDVMKRVNELIDERKKEKKKPLVLHENIINGVSNKQYDGNFYEINKKIIDLKNPILTEDAIEVMDGILDSPLDMEDRSFNNLVKLVYQDDIHDLLGDTRFASFFSPFKRIFEKEKEYFERNK